MRLLLRVEMFPGAVKICRHGRNHSPALSSSSAIIDNTRLSKDDRMSLLLFKLLMNVS